MRRSIWLLLYSTDLCNGHVKQTDSGHAAYILLSKRSTLLMVIAGCRTLNDVPRSEAMPAYLGLLLCLSAELAQLCGPCIHAQALLAQLHDPLQVCQLQRSPGASVVPLRQAQADLPS